MTKAPESSNLCRAAPGKRQNFARGRFRAGFCGPQRRSGALWPITGAARLLAGSVFKRITRLTLDGASSGEPNQLSRCRHCELGAPRAQRGRSGRHPSAEEFNAGSDAGRHDRVIRPRVRDSAFGNSGLADPTKSSPRGVLGNYSRQRKKGAAVAPFRHAAARLGGNRHGSIIIRIAAIDIDHLELSARHTPLGQLGQWHVELEIQPLRG